MENKKMSFDEYKNEIIKILQWYEVSLGIMSTEANMIKERYGYYLDDNSNCHASGDPDSVAYCLYMMS